MMKTKFIFRFLLPILFGLIVFNGLSTLLNLPKQDISIYSDNNEGSYTLASANNNNEGEYLENNKSEIDYNQYINKIWIVENWHGDVYTYPASFFIAKIENEKVFGKLATHKIAFPDFFYYRDEPDMYLADLTGTIENNIAECQFTDENGTNGKIQLEFKENDQIDAIISYNTINFMDKEQYYIYLNEMYKNTLSGREYLSKLAPVDGSYTFRPYNLVDIVEELDQSKIRTYEIELETWGKVDMVTVVYNGNKPYPTAFLTDEHSNIIYEFSAPYQVGTEIVDVIVEDINGDGLKDIIMTACFIGTTDNKDADNEAIEWRFYQMDNGLFYDSRLAEK